MRSIQNDFQRWNDMTDSLLEVKDLTVRFDVDEGQFDAVHQVST